MDSSAVIDLEALDGDESDYEVNFTDPKYNESHEQSSKGSSSSETLADNVKEQVTKNMTSYMFEAGKERAKKAFNVYGNIDILRPYFDVEPHEVRQRLLHSLVPQRPTADIRQKVPRELYGPLMVVFTLIAILLYQMKIGEHHVEEGTLMGSAFGICFGYWFGISGLVWVLAYICNTHITMLQILSLLGYGLFGHCVVLFLGTVFHTGHDHAMFYLLWAIFGGLSTLKMISVLVSRTAGQTQKLIVCGAVAVIHLLFLLYLHFAYHQIVEELSAVINERPIPLMEKALKPDENNGLEQQHQPLKQPHSFKVPASLKQLEVPDKAVVDVKRSIREAVPNVNTNLTAIKLSDTKLLDSQGQADKSRILGAIADKTGMANNKTITSNTKLKARSSDVLMKDKVEQVNAVPDNAPHV